ncbi:Elongation factor 4 [Bienertia sinuspersici]
MLKDEKNSSHFRMWAQAQDYEKRVEKAWNWKGEGTDMYKLTKKLKQVKSIIKELNKKGFCDIQVEANMAYQVLRRLRIKCIRIRKIQRKYKRKNRLNKTMSRSKRCTLSFYSKNLNANGYKKATKHSVCNSEPGGSDGRHTRKSGLSFLELLPVTLRGKERG